MSLKKQAFSGMVWTFGQQFSSQLVSFGISVILARLLLPSDFGAIAMFSVLTSIASSIVDSGMASSLIRSKDINDKDLSTVFWFNLLTSFFLYSVIFLIAPLVADFYNLPVLKNVIRVYSITLIINALVTVQGVTFLKKLDFKTGFKVQIPSQIIGGLSGIFFAYNGFGIWSIVYYNIIQTTVSTIQLWIYSNWKPSLVFSKEKFKEHFAFGYKLTLSGLLNTIFNNIYTVIIGKIFSAVQLGFYNRADTLKQLPVTNLSNALNKVTFPLFSKIKDNDEKLKEVYKRLMKVVVFIITPVLSVMIVVATPLINLVFTEKWLQVVPYFQVLALTGVLYPIHSYNLNILKVKGRTDLFLILEMIKKALIVIVLVVSLKYGIMGLIWGQVISSFLAFFINTYYTGKFLNYGPVKQFFDLTPTLLISGILATMMYYLRKYFLTGYVDIIQILIITFSYIVLYMSIALIFKFDELKYIKELIKK